MTQYTPLEMQIEGLAQQLHSAKLLEKKVVSNRVAIEEAIARLVTEEMTGADGQKTIKLPSGSVTVKRTLYYKGDTSAIRDMADQLCVAAPVTVKTVTAVDKKGYEWYRVNRPDLFAHFSPLIEVAPGKVSATFKPRKEG